VRQTVHGQPEQARAYRVVPHGPHQPPHWLRATFFAACPELPAFGRTATLGRGNSITLRKPHGGRVDESAWIQLIIAGGSGLIIIIGWLLRHSSRLTTTEVEIRGLEKNARDDRDRADRQNNNIMAALIRIEDQIQRKADR
jgi:hypothetical protein